MNGRVIANEGLCPVCESAQISIFFETFQVPIHCNLLLPTREEAIHAPRGDIRLGFCKLCGHVFNLAFDTNAMKYSQDYENSLHFSPRFQKYAKSLANRLIERYDLHNKNVMEIGCGKGDFLILLCELGENRGIGFDPSYVPEGTIGKGTERITFIQDEYSERYWDHKADFICCRHVLEHIQFPRKFLLTLRNTIGDQLDTVIFFEVPNLSFIIKDLGIWDIIYEHYSYFSKSSLGHLFQSCGFQIREITEAFGGQFLCVEASPKETSSASRLMPRIDLTTMTHDVELFAERYLSKVTTWRQKLEALENSGQRAVVWGAGSKGVMLLNSLKEKGRIKFAIDINPDKAGKYVAGSRQKIMSPRFLKEYKPDIILVMNRIYAQEIRNLVKSMNLDPDFIFA